MQHADFSLEHLSGINSEALLGTWNDDLLCLCGYLSVNVSRLTTDRYMLNPTESVRPCFQHWLQPNKKISKQLKGKTNGCVMLRYVAL